MPKGVNMNALPPSLLDDLQERLENQERLVQEQIARMKKWDEMSSSKTKVLTSEGTLRPNIELGIRLKLSGISLIVAAQHAKADTKLLIYAMNTEQGKELQARFRTEMDSEFKNLQSLVVQAIEKGLRSSDPQVSLGAANLWLRAEKETKLKVELTAEDIIKDLLEKRNAVQ